MTAAARASLILSAILAPASTQAQQQIGSWVLSCPSAKSPSAGQVSDACLMRLNQRFLDKAGITADLEIQARDKTLIPVLTVRGLPAEILLAASMAGKAQASIQFAGAPRTELHCGVSSIGYVCAPGDAAGQKLTASLTTARTVSVRIAIVIDGLKPLQAQEQSFDLSGTQQALARLREAGPAQFTDIPAASAAQPPAGLMQMADKMLKASGYPNGIASLQALVAKYLRQ